MFKATFFAVTIVAITTVAAVAEPVLSVPVSDSRNFAVARPGFKLPGPALQLAVERSDLVCSAITANFADGRTQDLFYGTLKMGTSKRINLVGTDIVKLTIICHALNRGGATLNFSAEP